LLDQRLTEKLTQEADIISEPLDWHPCTDHSAGDSTRSGWVLAAGSDTIRLDRTEPDGPAAAVAGRIASPTFNAI